jgi:hypothetical protein
MLNRSALILRYKQPFVDWINSADPSTIRAVSLAEVNEEQTVYLVEADDQDELDAWLAIHHSYLFEREMNAWYTDPVLWPSDRSLNTLREWCSLELHSVVVDIGESWLTDDDLDD